MKPEQNIDNWFIISDGVASRLMGHVRRYEGDTLKNFVRTSTIIGKYGDKIVTRNTVYNLLNKDTQFKQSKQGVLDSLLETTDV